MNRKAGADRRLGSTTMLDPSAADSERAHPAPTATPSLKPMPLRRLWWAAIVLLALSIGAVGFTIWQLRNDAIKSAITDTGNIAAILAGQLSRSLNTIDGMLLEIRGTSKGLDIDTPAKLRAIYGTKEMHDTMRAHLATVPHIFNMVVADENGQLVVSTAAWPTPAINVGDRDYFKTARARLDGRLSTSVPIRNRIDGNQTIVFARRLETPSGEFAGIIFASVNSNYFEAIYGSTQSIRSPDLQPDPGRRHDPVPSSRRGRLCRQEALAGSGLAGLAPQRQAKLPYPRKGGQQLSLCVGPARAGVPAVRQHLADRKRRAGRLAAAFGDDRPRQRRVALVLDLPVDRDHATSPLPEQVGGFAAADVAAARRRAEQHGARHQHVRQGAAAGRRQQAIRGHVQYQPRPAEAGNAGARHP